VLATICKPESGSGNFPDMSLLFSLDREYNNEEFEGVVLFSPQEVRVSS
jgi:hypothetical protein